MLDILIPIYVNIHLFHTTIFSAFLPTHTPAKQKSEKKAALLCAEKQKSESTSPPHFPD
jgi:hypothetical protein